MKKPPIERIAHSCCRTLAVLAIALCAALAPAPSYARSLLYYYDFDTIENSSLVYTNSTEHTDINKGSGTAEFAKSSSSGAAIPYTTSGAFDSSGAYCATSKNTIWLGDGTTSLGGSTTNGFTISFWLKATSSHTAWRDFFGFTVGGTNYRLEYTTVNTTEFTIYYPTSSSSDLCALTNIVTDTNRITQAPAGEWKHVAFVFSPSAESNNVGRCAIYIGGVETGAMTIVKPGSLTRVCVGPLVAAWNNTQRNASNSGNETKTGIDELAMFDYPATAEQVKWLGKYKPAQPANGPGREMPLFWPFDEATASAGILALNAGTGTNTAYKWESTAYANYKTDGGALGSPRAFHLNNNATWRVDGQADDGLGATVGSGFAISFWLYEPSSVTAWRDVMSFRLGNWYERLEWKQASNPVMVGMYGTVNALNAAGSGGSLSMTASTWQHVCIVWNDAKSAAEFYLDGEPVDMSVTLTSAEAGTALKSLTAGTQVFSETGSRRNQGYFDGAYIDELAVFNHSLSQEQIAWLGANVPALPPLDATNLVRTVSADCSWAGGLASWTVRDWDGDGAAWTNTTRTTIWPALEDTEVEVEVSFTSSATITNDTFITPKRLALRSDGALAVAPTLVCADGSMFDPATLELGEGVSLSVAAGAICIETGTIAFSDGSSIKVDCEEIGDGWTTVLSAAGYTLPEGSDDVLNFIKPANGNYQFKVDGNAILAKKVRGLIISFR